MARTRVQDRRVRRTQGRRRDALVSLIHEKRYDTIVVKEILERADVGRTAFYSHFRDKDARSPAAFNRCCMRIVDGRIDRPPNSSIAFYGSAFRCSSISTSFATAPTSTWTGKVVADLLVEYLVATFL